MDNVKLLEVLRLYAKSGIFSLCLMFGLVAYGQDPVFSQYYMNQNYLNPAFAGYTNDLSATLNSRIQYMGVPGVLTTNTLAANIGCKDKSVMGFGLLLNDHVEGEGLLHTVSVAGQVSANIELKKRHSNKRQGLISGGLQFGLGQKFIDWDKLTFSDQYSPYTQGIQNESFLSPNNPSSNIYLDLGAGIRGMYQFETRNPIVLSYGLSSFHINKPAQTFFNTKVYLQPRYTYFVFTNFSGQGNGRVNSRKYWSVGVLGDFQQGMRSHTLTVSKETSQYIGVGMSFRRQNFLIIDKNMDALIFHTNFQINDLTLGVSYDWTISTLGEEKTFGTFELGLKYVFYNKNLCKGKGGKAGRSKNANVPCASKGFKHNHEVPKFGML